MRTVRTWILILAAICLAVSAAAAEEDYLGKPLADFTAETIGGGSFTLSEALKEKELVIINLWATWCGPCGMEFPYMEEVYEQYQDRVEIIAQLFGVTVRRIQQLTQEGVLPTTETDGVSGHIAFDETGDTIRTSAFVKTVNSETGAWEFLTEQTVE